jgi:2-polyprenyl-6-methoxyphenol hydroxylase-like FAD-dependent oxidoreductase
MVDNEFFGLIAKRGKGGLWRVTYGDSTPDITEEQYLARRAIAFKKLLPGHPDPDQYQVTQTDQFRIHNRCVDSFRVGRILLAADAAHVVNPFGGYGCMTALLDVGGLADCLIGVYEGKADDSILDLYARIRREKFLKYVDRRSMKNLNRIVNSDPDTVLETDPFLQLLKGLEGDDEATKAFIMVSASGTTELLCRLPSAV